MLIVLFSILATHRDRVIVSQDGDGTAQFILAKILQIVLVTGSYDGGGKTVNIFDFFDRISDLDEKCLYSAKNVYTSKDLKKISPSLKNVYIL